MLAQAVKIEDKQIEAVKNWPEPTLIRDIQVFIGFANFYQRFTQGFSRIATLLTSLLKTTGLSKESAPKLFRADNNEVVEVGSRVNEIVVNLSKNKKSPTSIDVSSKASAELLHHLLPY